MQELNKRKKVWNKIKKDKFYYLMFLPVFVMTIIFNYIPMFGIRYAFYKFTPFKKEFIGLDNFKNIFFGINSQRFWLAFKNTIILSLSNLILGIIASVVLALLLNEVYNKKIRGAIQTIVYLPHFLSWVVTASIFTIILSPQGGFINSILEAMGKEPIYFLTSEKWWRPIFLLIYRWKETGWGTIIYLAAMTSINPQLYEAAEIDGAGRWRQTIYITIPALMPTILVVFVLNLGKVLNIFESVFVLYNSMVHNVADVIGTFTYRIGMQQADYGLGTAIGLFKSLIAMILVLITNKVSQKVRGSDIL
ncbi:MAG: ABC transporter permease subunit [Caldicoprobacter sp.]|uniref:ABC transporter permease n=1 Tax=Caldicoprobacter sp. TaxID=2004500 RepID=UPI0039C1A5A9